MTSGRDFDYFAARLILPRRRLGIIAAITLVPNAPGRSHPQSFMRTQMVVLVAKPVQPTLPFFRSGIAAPLQCRRHRAMKPLHLALRLRVTIAAEVQTNALLHQPYR